MTPAEALAEFLAPEPSPDGRPASVVFGAAPDITDAMARRWDAFELLVARRSEQLGRSIHVEDGEMCEVQMILDAVADKTVFSLSVEELTAIVEELAEGADIDADVDEDGFGEACVVPGMSFEDAREALRWRTVRTVRTRRLVRALRARRRAGTSRRRAGTLRRARSPGRLSGDDDPHDVIPCRRAAIPAQCQVPLAGGRLA